MTKHTPKHLKDAGKAFWKKVLSEFQFENEHDFKKLAICGECLDNIETGREEIKQKGSFYTDRFGQPRAHPAYGLIKDNMIIFCRVLRELNLDIEPPATPKPPPLY